MLTKLLKICCNSRQCTFAKPFEAMPGPRGPFGLGNLYNYMPGIGSYSWLKLHKAGQDKYEKYGAIVRETMVPGQDIVWLYDPKDIATLLNERDCPQRRSHLALAQYRKQRPHLYKTTGLLPTNGPDWWRLRAQVQKELSAPRSVRSFVPEVDGVTQEFLKFLRHTEGNDATIDMLPKLTRLNLELTCLLTFGARIESFSPAEQHAHSRSTRLMHAAETTNSCILPTDQGLQLWRYVETPSFRKLRIAQSYMESVALELLEQTMEEGTSSSSLIAAYIQNPQLDRFDVVGTSADLLLAGIDTTSYASAFLLYHVARHPEVQQRIYEEALKVLPNAEQSLSADALRTDITYTRAVLKESLRLNPISIGFGRVLNQDTVLSGYFVPKGTTVVTQNMVACRQPHHFPEPLSFLPDRWLQQRNALNPYLVLPFGHGMRACIARRLAEQNMHVLLLRLLRNYELIWRGQTDEELDIVTLLINKPNAPVLIELRSRST
ncbi:cytochrome P450 302a1, mitochondrial [Drosophila sulfurigaster albostrigata]|uniref:cytochrome P450 302a1, mitochondrial n=1 Tax=Drosophila sulfurigaster albostrigata TaxID=89887 RepID=UPI002D21C4BA|nr:cytochrome P450 302a1, mitochondrial [Drosophila sulfurigaster albostrigata]